MVNSGMDNNVEAGCVLSSRSPNHRLSINWRRQELGMQFIPLLAGYKSSSHCLETKGLRELNVSRSRVPSNR